MNSPSPPSTARFEPQRMLTPYGPTDPGQSHRSAQLCGRKQRHAMIAQAAYFRAKHRRFAPGHELQDWLAAEAEVDAALDLGLFL